MFIFLGREELRPCESLKMQLRIKSAETRLSWSAWIRLPDWRRTCCFLITIWTELLRSKVSTCEIPHVHTNSSELKLVLLTRNTASAGRFVFLRTVASSCC